MLCEFEAISSKFFCHFFTIVWFMFFVHSYSDITSCFPQIILKTRKIIFCNVLIVSRITETLYDLYTDF